jgi:hypothetical protein
MRAGATKISAANVAAGIKKGEQSIGSRLTLMSAPPVLPKYELEGIRVKQIGHPF